MVVSALSGVTETLLELANLVRHGNRNYEKALDELERRHVEMATELVDRNDADMLITMERIFEELRGVLRDCLTVKNVSPESSDRIVSFWERLSAHIATWAFRHEWWETHFVDARNWIVTDDSFSSAVPDLEETGKRIREFFQTHTGIAVVTGFIGATRDGRTTTLGRGGSDYTAAIVASAINAERIELWKEVDGIMTADPRNHPQAIHVRSLTFLEAETLSCFGAKVVYMPTIRPAMEKGIPIVVRNTFNPSGEGTVIGSEPECGIPRVKCITSMDMDNGFTVVTLVGEGIGESEEISGTVKDSLKSRGVRTASVLERKSGTASLSVLVHKEGSRKTVDALHEAFFH